MTSYDFAFDDNPKVEIKPFNPEAAFRAFELEHRNISVQDIRVFFLNAGKLKKTLKLCPKLEITARFGSWSVKIKNTINRSLGELVLSETDLTLHRISGYLALIVLRKATVEKQLERDMVKEHIVNPIAESQGVTWNNSKPEIYLSFFPGTEFFLKDFLMYPLAIGVTRVRRGLMTQEFLAKLLRQKFEGKDPNVWMVEKVNLVKNAVDELAKYPLTKASSGPHVKEFLAKLGINYVL
ncbi:N [Tanga virus]|uniref:Nucleoprotein n=1 Tax=Tanga virus TaxID=2748249 RepID=A0A7D9MVT9_9VIRU|nr:N [Tanga virus] [Tanga virus]QLA47023.1 N [Tanga virus] [Tanga virus]